MALVLCCPTGARRVSPANNENSFGQDTIDAGISVSVAPISTAFPIPRTSQNIQLLVGGNAGTVQIQECHHIGPCRQEKSPSEPLAETMLKEAGTHIRGVGRKNSTTTNYHEALVRLVAQIDQVVTNLEDCLPIMLIYRSRDRVGPIAERSPP